MTSRTDPARPAGELGFTLIEVLVVVAVLGLVAGLVLSRGAPRSSGLEMRAQAGQIVAALRGARGQAIATNRRVAFVLDAPLRSFRVGTGQPVPLAPRIEAAMAPETIVFSPDGSASGGRIVLAEGAARLQVRVDGLTGRVSVADGN